MTLTVPIALAVLALIVVLFAAQAFLFRRWAARAPTALLPFLPTQDRVRDLEAEVKALADRMERVEAKLAPLAAIHIPARRDVLAHFADEAISYAEEQARSLHDKAGGMKWSWHDKAVCARDRFAALARDAQMEVSASEIEAVLKARVAVHPLKLQARLLSS